MLLEDLKIDLDKASQKGSLSKYLDWRVAHKKGVALWHNLASFSLNNIDPNSRGNSELFAYLGAATEFEDLLYGLEPYYRDHTLHSIWVYLTGEHILRNELPELHENLFWYLFNDIEHDKNAHPQKLREKSKKKEK